MAQPPWSFKRVLLHPLPRLGHVWYHTWHEERKNNETDNLSAKLSSETFTELYLLWKDADVVLKKLHSTFQRYPMYVTFSFTSETSESARPILREKNDKHEEKWTSCTSQIKLDWKELNANTMLRYTARIPSQMMPFIRTTCSSRK